MSGQLAASARLVGTNKVAEPVVSLDEFLPADVVTADCGRWLKRCDAILTAVARWTEEGESAR